MDKYLDILGHRVYDRITGYSGVATSVSFDLYGCVQVNINPGLTAEGKLGDQYWFDYSRVVVASETKVMDPPAVFKSDTGPETKSCNAKA